MDIVSHSARADWLVNTYNNFDLNQSQLVYPTMKSHKPLLTRSIFHGTFRRWGGVTFIIVRNRLGKPVRSSSILDKDVCVPLCAAFEKGTNQSLSPLRRYSSRTEQTLWPSRLVSRSKRGNKFKIRRCSACKFTSWNCKIIKDFDWLF